MEQKIPRIIHQIWIGPKPAPTKFMDSWKEKHPDFEYIRWSEAEMEKRGMTLRCEEKMGTMSELCGKADIMRWEILYKYGGIYIDADSICIEPLDDTLLKCKAFANYENEQARKGLVSNGTMGFYPQHPLCRDAIEWILKNEISMEKTGYRAWKMVGPGLLTNLLNQYKYKDFTIFPSYTFLPIHYTQLHYKGHGKVYAYQEWGSTKQNYDAMNQIELPAEFNEPKKWVSMVIPSYNTKHVFIVECLNSIKIQEGHVGIELIWINDGSDALNTTLLERELEKFQASTRFIKVVYQKMEQNRGITACLNAGLALCSHDLVFRMDSDDIMDPQRIPIQLEFMEKNPASVLCGSNVVLFQTDKGEKKITGNTNHPKVLQWEDYKKKPSHWFMNHPTLCFRREAILSLGGYDETIQKWEDLHLEVRVLKQYGAIYNIEKPLVFYRIHENQVTYQGKASPPHVVEERTRFIAEMCKE